MSDAAPINPYEPPQGPPIVDDRPEPEIYFGPWRDRGLLVIDIDEKDYMPWRCVLSGVNLAPGQRVRFTIYPGRPNLPIGLLHRYWPVAPEKRPLWRIVDVVGWGFIIVGIGGLMSLVLPYGVGTTALWPLVFLALVGALLLRWFDGKQLKFVRVAGRQVWVSGAHPNFLAMLPPWPGTGPR